MRRVRVLCPVIRPTPGRDEDLKARERVLNRRLGARMALRDSAAVSGAELGALEKDERDAPMPSNGWHWSISHCTEIVAGVVFSHPVGIDVQKVEQRKPFLIPRVTSHDEQLLLGGFSWHAFTRTWTAKEAVLKKQGVGLSELSRCRIVAVPSESSMVLHHAGQPHFVHQHCFEELGEVFSVAVCAEPVGDFELTWIKDTTPCPSLKGSIDP